MSTLRQRLAAAVWKNGGGTGLQHTTSPANEQFLDDLVAAAQPMVTREQIVQVVEQHDHKYPNREAWLRAIVPALHVLLTGQPERRWCREDCPWPWRWMALSEGDKAHFFRELHGQKIQALQECFCDACGEKRPSETT